MKRTLGFALALLSVAAICSAQQPGDFKPAETASVRYDRTLALEAVSRPILELPGRVDFLHAILQEV